MSWQGEHWVPLTIYPYRSYSISHTTYVLLPLVLLFTLLRHLIETFSALLTLCKGKPPVTGGFPLQKPMTRSFDVFFGMGLNKWLSKQSKCRWFETPCRSLCCRCSDQFWGIYRKIWILLLYFCVRFTISVDCDIIGLGETGPWDVYVNDTSTHCVHDCFIGIGAIIGLPQFQCANPGQYG